MSTTTLFSSARLVDFWQGKNHPHFVDFGAAALVRDYGKVTKVRKKFSDFFFFVTFGNFKENSFIPSIIPFSGLVFFPEKVISSVEWRAKLELRARG